MKNLKVLLVSFDDGKEVMGVCQEGVAHDGSVLGQLITLDEVGVEGIQDQNLVVYGGVREVGPVEAVGKVLGLNYANSFIIVLWVVMSISPRLTSYI